MTHRFRAAALVLLAAITAQGDEKVRRPGGGLWEDSSQWIGGLPTDLDSAAFGNNEFSSISVQTPVTVTSLSFLAGQTKFDLAGGGSLNLTGDVGIRIGGNAGETVQASITNGVLTCNAVSLSPEPTNQTSRLIAGTSGQINTTSVVAGIASFGSVGARGGAFSVSQDLTLGQSATGIGEGFSDGAGSSFHVGGLATVGAAGTATFSATSGGKSDFGSLVVGANVTSNAQVNVTGNGSRTIVLGDATIAGDGRGGITVGQGAEFSGAINVFLATGATGSTTANIAGKFQAQNLFVGGDGVTVGGTATVEIKPGANVQLDTLQIGALGTVTQTGGNVFAQSLVGTTGSYKIDSSVNPVTLTVGRDHVLGEGPLDATLVVRQGTTINFGQSLGVATASQLSFAGGGSRRIAWVATAGGSSTCRAVAA